jgi:hypothetical protein
MMGAVLEGIRCLSPETARRVLEDTVKNLDLLELDRKALVAGRDFINHMTPALSPALRYGN